MFVDKIKKTILCEVSEFRYLSNINGLSLLDGTYLERLISFLLINKNQICFEGVANIKDFMPLFEVGSVEGVKQILARLYDAKALTLFQKCGKHHEHKYIFSVNLDYTKYFYK